MIPLFLYYIHIVWLSTVTSVNSDIDRSIKNNVIVRSIQRTAKRNSINFYLWSMNFHWVPRWNHLGLLDNEQSTRLLVGTMNASCRRLVRVFGGVSNNYMYITLNKTVWTAFTSDHNKTVLLSRSIIIQLYKWYTVRNIRKILEMW